MISIVKPSAEHLTNVPEPTDAVGVMQWLEAIGRTCYKSEDKISPISAQKFIENIFKRKHWAMLEHYIFVFEVDEADINYMRDMFVISTGYDSDVAEKMNYIRMSTEQIPPIAEPGNEIKYRSYISGSATAFNYLLEAMQKADMNLNANNGNENTIGRICEYMQTILPEIFRDPDLEHTLDGVTAPGHNPHRKDIRLLSRAEVRALPLELRKVHDFMTFRIITDRGVTHELVRHRPMSYAMESTRYCNYGNKGYQFILPEWLCNPVDGDLTEQKLLLDPEWMKEYVGLFDRPRNWPLSAATTAWLNLAICSADSYEIMLRYGNKRPEQCRAVLPHDIKAEIIMTGRLNEWTHFFNMRIPATAHPDMRMISRPMMFAACEYDRELYEAQHDALMGGK
ncbi:MAG: FAD-dependent thymidylate synthase [Muribaculaceae bacterium]|nr:FAD-dependent thymidylate synthase [Muribaculaceae bacterium]